MAKRITAKNSYEHGVRICRECEEEVAKLPVGHIGRIKGWTHKCYGCGYMDEDGVFDSWEHFQFLREIEANAKADYEEYEYVFGDAERDEAY